MSGSDTVRSTPWPQRAARCRVLRHWYYLGMSDDPPTEPTSRTPAQHTTDYLANERTFLAWVRSALAVIGLGFVVARFGLYLRQLAAAGGRPMTESAHSALIGELLIALGTLLLPAALVRFLTNQQRIARGAFTPSRVLEVAFAGVMTAVGVALFVLLLVAS
jgi:putative membrane protein